MALLHSVLYHWNGHTRNLVDFVQHADNSHLVLLAITGTVLHNDDNPDRMHGYVNATYRAHATDRNKPLSRRNPRRCFVTIRGRPFGLEIGGTFSHVLHHIDIDNQHLTENGFTVFVDRGSVTFAPNSTDPQRVYTHILEEAARSFFAASPYSRIHLPSQV